VTISSWPAWFARLLDRHADEGELMALLDQELSPKQTELLQRHVGRCGRCQARLSELRQARWRVRSLIKPVPAEVLKELSDTAFAGLQEKLSSLPTESAIRAAFGKGLSQRALRTSGELQAAIDTMLGSRHPAPSLRWMPQYVWFAAGLFGALALSTWLYWLSSGGWSETTAGDFRMMEAVFGKPYRLYLVLSALAATALSFGTMGQFPRKHPLHAAWMALAVAAVSRMVGLTVAAAPVLLGSGVMHLLELSGQLIGGPVSLCALRFGLLSAHRAYRSIGLTARLKWIDYGVLAAGVLFTIRHIVQVVGILLGGQPQDLLVMLGWLSDPVLLFTLMVAVPLRRIAVSQGGGYVAHCWAAMACGTLLTLYLETTGLLPWPWSSITWLVWIPAAAMFTVGPAYQFAANAAFPARESVVSPTHS
jgi:hypothetical protein